MNVPEWALACDERRIPDRHGILEPKAVSKRKHQWAILARLEHDRGGVDPRRVRAKKMRHESCLGLGGQIIGRQKRKERGPSSECVGIESSLAVGELVTKMNTSRPRDLGENRLGGRSIAGASEQETTTENAQVLSTGPERPTHPSSSRSGLEQIDENVQSFRKLTPAAAVGQDGVCELFDDRFQGGLLEHDALELAPRTRRRRDHARWGHALPTRNRRGD